MQRGETRARGGRSATAPGRRRARRLLACLAIAGCASTANAAAFIVTTTADSGAGSLRAAIASANTTPGADAITFDLTGCPCTITLASVLTVTDALTIAGPGMSLLTLNGANAVQVMTTTAVPVAISDLAIRDGKSATTGGGIAAAGDLALTRVTVQSNTAATYGGGVLGAAKVTVVDSVFASNVAVGFDGGGLYSTGALVVTGSQFLYNETLTSKGYGGGGGLISFGPTTITNTQFANNTSADWGGGAYIADFAASPSASTTTLTDVQFTTNTANSGGGGGGFFWFGTTLTRVAFSGNYASYRGGGAYAGYAGSYPITVASGQFTGNSATGGGGLYSDSDLSIDGTLIDGNTARSGNGGGVWTIANATVGNATITRNTVISAGNSGGIDTSASLTITDSTVSDNQTLTGSGGGTGSGANATVTNVRYLNNSAPGSGGGLLSFGTVTVSGATFTGNHAGNLGGGLYGTIVIATATTFTDNVAAANWGGGAFAANDATLTNTTFIHNTSKFAGGGAAAQAGNVQVTGGLFQGNVATGGGWGGAIYAGGPSITIGGTQFLSNSSDARGGALASNTTSIANAVFDGNTTSGVGGALATQGPTDIAFTLLRSNMATGDGGGVWTVSSIAVSRSRFLANIGASGGGIFQDGSGGTIVNTLFSHNHATGFLGEALSVKTTVLTSIRQTTIGSGAFPAPGSALYVNGGSVELLNSIVASHSKGIERAAGSVSANYNLFSGNATNTVGTGIVNAHPFSGNPAFADPANDDYHIGLGSAAIDAGPSVGVTIDYDGNVRPAGSGFDLGYAESIASFAATQRTFVASFGTDASTGCTASAPCRSLSTALDRTLAGGEVVVLDSGAYDTVTITRPVSILAATGIYAGISAFFNETAVTIAAGSTDQVFLRGLTITSAGGDRGIAFYSGGALHLEDMVVRGYRQPGQVNIDFQPIANSKLSVKDSRVQSGAIGLRIQNGGGEVGVEVDNTRFENNGNSIFAAANGSIAVRNSIVTDGSGDGINLNGANGFPLTATLDRLLISGNSGNGVGSGGTLPVYAAVYCSIVRGNGTGVFAAGGASPSITRLSRTTVTRNSTGVGTGSGGSILSRGDNTIEGNTVNGTPGATYAGR